jgi:general secretion pathway protein N
LLVLVGVLVYMGAVIALMPAGWLWQQAKGRVALPPDVAVKQVNGRLWHGVAGLVVAGFPVRADWSLGVPSLLSMKLPIDFSVATEASVIRGDAWVSWQGNGELQASGRVGVAEFENLIRRSGGAVIEGDVTIDRLQLAWEDRAPTRIDGLGRWGGGAVTWPMGNREGRADFPPMRAMLDSVQGGIQLLVAEEGGDSPAAAAEIQWTGMLDLRVYKRMVDLAGQPWPDSAAPDDVIFRVRQPLIPGGL